MYGASCIWHNQDRKIPVMRMDAQPLIGMELMKNCRLSIDVMDSGPVKIQQLDNA